MESAFSLQEDELPEAFETFWEDWYATSQKHAVNFFQLLPSLEKLLFESQNEIFTHPVASDINRALRFWQLQVERHSSEKQINLIMLIESWDLFRNSFLPRIAHHKSILLKAFAVVYSFTGLTIIKSIDKETLQKQSSASLFSAISDQSNPQENVVEHSWAIDLLTAKFQKTIGHLVQAESILQKLADKLQQSTHNAIYGSTLFELCDVYSQMDKEEQLHRIVRRLFQQNPISWDLTLVGSQFCNTLVQKLPQQVRSQFLLNDPVALNWGGLYALADGGYGAGALLSHQMQKNYWGQILQLKKAISDQGKPSSANDFYSLQRAQLLIYYILILEHLSWVRKTESSAEALEENSRLWQNVMIEIYSLSEDISQRCKHRFS